MFQYPSRRNLPMSQNFNFTVFSRERIFWATTILSLPKVRTTQEYCNRGYQTFLKIGTEIGFLMGNLPLLKRGQMSPAEDASFLDSGHTAPHRSDLYRKMGITSFYNKKYDLSPE